MPPLAQRAEWAYALTSLPPQHADAARLEQLGRGHWQIENGLHCVRDVTLGEDACQVRMERAPANLAACRNAALTLPRQHGVTNIAAALRRHAMYPREALALLGLKLEGKDPGWLTAAACAPARRHVHYKRHVYCRHLRSHQVLWRRVDLLRRLIPCGSP